MKKHVVLTIPLFMWIDLTLLSACINSNNLTVYSQEPRGYSKQEVPGYSFHKYQDINLNMAFVNVGKDSIKVLSNQFEESKGNLPWPVEKGFIRWNHPPCFGNVHFKPYMDIVTRKNSTVRCVFNGRVVKVFKIPGNNTTVIIRHGDYLTTYSNIVKLKVKTGDFVLQNKKIGKVCTNDHEDGELTFQIWHLKNKLNAEEWLAE